MRHHPPGDLPSLIEGFVTQPVIDGQRKKFAVLRARPVRGQQNKRHAVTPARHTDGDARTRLERTEPVHQTRKFRRGDGHPVGRTTIRLGGIGRG